MRFTHILAAFAVILAAAACSFTEIDDVQSAPEQSSQYLQVVGRVAQYTDRDVATRSKKEGDEPKVTSMGLALFPINDNGTIGNCLYYDFELGGSIVFIVDRHDDVFNSYEDKPFAMYIFANMQDAEGFPLTSEDGVGKPLDYFTKCEAATSANVADIPANGFPMVGSLGNTVSTNDKDGIKLILKPTPTDTNLDGLPLVNDAPTNNLEIPLKSLYAKFSFTISVKPDQEIVGNKAPRFDLLSYAVNNIAATVDSDSSTNNDDVIPTSGDVSMGSYAQGATTVDFDFYLPERYLTPSKSIDEVLPDELKSGTSDEVERYRQRYKNKMVEDQAATHVTITGKYTDHQSNIYDVDYNIYLGGNNYDDFNIIRNTHYDNSLTIRGITATDDPTPGANHGIISIDWRVDVERSSPLVIGLLRESQLDAHYEVRPLRLRLVGDDIPTGTSATVQILNQDGTTNNLPGWIRLEMSGTSPNHITEGISAGKRMYFTTDLVTGTLADGTSVTVTDLDRSNQTVWVYVDENNTIDSRAALVRVTYDDGDTKDFKFVQHGLHKVTAESGRTYYIEEFEEYLYNYDVEDSYGQIKEEGMPWGLGLNGVQLSNAHYSYDNSLTPNVDWEKYEESGTKRPYYDFYTWKQDSTVLKTAGLAQSIARHEFAGRDFTKEIAENRNASVRNLTLAQQADGAVEYCYNRNKRKSDGSIEKVDWYLPSADELEDFIVSAYSDFKEFQDNYYWTSQPAYIRNIFYYEHQDNIISSKTVTHVIVYDDNPNYARATKVVYNDGKYFPAHSGLDPEPTPFVDRRYPTAENNKDLTGYENIGYFYQQHKWKRWRSGLSMKEEYGPDIKGTYYKGDEGYTYNNKSYYFHLGFLDEMMQEGYHHRTKNNRVRCVRVAPE